MQFFEIVVIGDFLPGTGWWIFALWTVFQVFHAVGFRSDYRRMISPSSFA